MKLPPFVDLHGDILYDVTHRRTFKGEKHTLETYHLQPMQQGGIKVQVLPIYFDSINLPEAALRQTMITINAFLEEMDEAGAYFRVIKNKADLSEVMAGDKIGVILAMEGAEGIGRDVGLIRLFYELGLRMIGLTWNRANALGEGSGENTGAALSVLGQQLVSSLAQFPIILDVSHLNEAGFWSALDHCQGPVLASHSNSSAIHPHHRNLTDAQIKALAGRGGLIGLNFYPGFVTPDAAQWQQGLIRHAKHIAALVGIDHIAIGPDFTNYLPNISLSAQEMASLGVDSDTIDASPEVTLLPQFYEALCSQGFSSAEAGAIIGGNALRFFSQALPD